MRVMAYIGSIVFLIGLWGAWVVRRKKVATSKWFLRAAIWAAVLPFIMNTSGWMLTENGRQPWIVQGLQRTSQGISPSVSTSWIGISLGTFVLLYLVMGVIDGVLMIRYSRKPLDDPPSADGEGAQAMTY